MPLVGLTLDDAGIERPQTLVPDAFDAMDENAEQFGRRFLAVAIDRIVRAGCLPGGLDAVRLFPFGMKLGSNDFRLSAMAAP